MAKRSKLTAKQQKFVDNYLVSLNASEAALKAGYSKKSAGKIGFQLLENTRIQAEIEKALQKQQERTQITADYVLKNIKAVAERCMQAEPVMIKDENGNMVESGEYKFDSSGANKALENLGRHLKLFTDRKEVALPGIDFSIDRLAGLSNAGKD